MFSVTKSQNSNEEEKNFITPKAILWKKIWKEMAAHQNGKLSCNCLIMLVTMATSISSQVRDKNSIFTVRDEDIIFKQKEKSWYFISIYTINDKVEPF